jgi:hypothetical protein
LVRGESHDVAPEPLNNRRLLQGYVAIALPRFDAGRRRRTIELVRGE